ncbi:transposable element Tc1 transposase [Trichonephila clavipes]|nr:transposable element Tc1 transposase [Trichonephila clavipes]
MMPSRRFRRHYRQLNDFELGPIVGMREAELSYLAIGHHLQRTNTAIQRCWRQSSSVPPVVPSNISRRLAEAGFRSQRPLRCLPLNPQHRLNRLEFPRSKASWLPLDCHRIVFNDESRFTLEVDDHRLHVQRNRV